MTNIFAESNRFADLVGVRFNGAISNVEDYLMEAELVVSSEDDDHNNGRWSTEDAARTTTNAIHDYFQAPARGRLRLLWLNERTFLRGTHRASDALEMVVDHVLHNPDHLRLFTDRLPPDRDRNETLTVVGFNDRQQQSEWLQCFVVGPDPYPFILGLPLLLQERLLVIIEGCSLSGAQGRSLARFQGGLCLRNFIFDDGGVAFAEGLRRQQHNQGPWYLGIHGPDCAAFNREGYGELRRALRANTRLREICFSGPKDEDHEMFFVAIKASRICKLTVVAGMFFKSSNRNWESLVDSLRAHPTITTLEVVDAGNTTQAQANSFVSALASNTVITTMTIRPQFASPDDREVLDRIVQVNLIRLRTGAMQELDPLFRAKQLGPDLFAFRDRPWLLYHVVRQNIDLLEQSPCSSIPPHSSSRGARLVE